MSFDESATKDALCELVDLWRSHLGRVLMSRREHELIGLGIYGLTAHTHALARAVLTLDDAGQIAATAPLVRQALECAISAVWLELAGYPAVLSLVREHSRQQRNLLAEFVKSGLEVPGPALAQADADLQGILTSQSKAGEKFAERCKEIVGGDNVYAIYRALSSTSHAGAAVVDLYLKDEQIAEDSRSDTTLLLEPHLPSEASHLGIMLSMLVAAGSAWSRIDKDRYQRTRLKELSHHLQIAFKHELTVYGLAQQRKCDREYRTWSAGC